MALLSYSLCAVSDIEKQTGKTYAGDDIVVVENMINLATEYAEKFIGRHIKTHGVIPIEYFDLDYETREIFLRNFPIISISIVQEDPDADTPPTPLVADDEYFSYENTGKLIRREQARWFRGDDFRSVAVTYQGGYATVPADLLQWCVEVVTAMFQEKTLGNVKSERVGQLSVQYAGVTSGDIANIVNSKPYLQNVLNMYKGNYAL